MKEIIIGLVVGFMIGSQVYMYFAIMKLIDFKNEVEKFIRKLEKGDLKK